MTPPLVYVEWEDAHEKDLESGWVHATEHVYEPVIVRQVGYLLTDVPQGVILTASWHPDFTGPRTTIPRGMIVKLCPIKTMKPAYAREGDEA